MQDFRRLLLLLVELVTLTRFILIIGAVPVAALLVTAQGQELLDCLVENPDPRFALSGTAAWFVFSLVVFGLTAWYWAQKSLIPFKDRLNRAAPRGRLHALGLSLQDWYPRLIAVAPMALIASYEFAIGHSALATWIAGSAVVLVLGLYWRRKLLRWLAGKSFSMLAPIADRPHNERADSLWGFFGARFMGVHAWLALSLVITIVFAVVIIPLRSPAVPQAIGTPAVAFLWAAATVPIGTLLAVLASTWRKPILLASVVSVTLVSCWQSDLHAPRVVRANPNDPSDEQGARQQRVAAEIYGTLDVSAAEVDVSRCRFPETSGRPPWTPLSRVACAWLIDRMDAGAPLSASARGSEEPVFVVVLVSAEGGGIRAALWTAAGLARLRDHHARSRHGFADRIFAMSGASGGSLGIGVFAAMNADDQRCGRPGADSFARIAEVLSRDFLAPTVAGYLFTDLVRPIGRFSWLEGDRVTYLERSWEDSYARTYRAHDPDCRRNALQEPFDALWGGGGALRVPLLFLNTTQVHDGRRSVVAPAVAFGRPNWIAPRSRHCIHATTADRVFSAECYLDGFENAVDVVELVGAPIALSTAIGLSARFPFVTSVANIPAADSSLRQLADGGYFDNSATITMREIVDLLPTRVEQIKANGPRQLVRVVPLVLHFVNDPDPAPSAEAPGSALTTQALAPLQTLESARSARNFVARIALHERVQERGGHFMQVDIQGRIADGEKGGGFGALPECVPMLMKHSPPLGWVMSNRTNEAVIAQSKDDRALACLDACVDWALGKEGAVCPAQARPRPIEVEDDQPATPVASEQPPSEPQPAAASGSPHRNP